MKYKFILIVTNGKKTEKLSKKITTSIEHELGDSVRIDDVNKCTIISLKDDDGLIVTKLSNHIVPKVNEVVAYLKINYKWN